MILLLIDGSGVGWSEYVSGDTDTKLSLYNISYVYAHGTGRQIATHTLSLFTLCFFV